MRLSFLEPRLLGCLCVCYTCFKFLLRPFQPSVVGVCNPVHGFSFEVVLLWPVISCSPEGYQLLGEGPALESSGEGGPPATPSQHLQTPPGVPPSKKEPGEESPSLEGRSAPGGHSEGAGGEYPELFNICKRYFFLFFLCFKMFGLLPLRILVV